MTEHFCIWVQTKIKNVFLSVHNKEKEEFESKQKRKKNPIFFYQ